jgi:hypothetical protein
MDRTFGKVFLHQRIPQRTDSGARIDDDQLLGIPNRNSMLVVFPPYFTVSGPGQGMDLERPKIVFAFLWAI